MDESPRLGLGPVCLSDLLPPESSSNGVCSHRRDLRLWTDHHAVCIWSPISAIDAPGKTLQCETHVSQLRGLTGFTAAAVGTQDLEAQRIERPLDTMWISCVGDEK